MQVHVTSGVYTVAIKGGSTVGTDNPSLLPTKTKFYGRYNSDTWFHRSKENICLPVICKNTKSQETFYWNSYEKNRLKITLKIQ